MQDRERERALAVLAAGGFGQAAQDLTGHAGHFAEDVADDAVAQTRQQAAILEDRVAELADVEAANPEVEIKTGERAARAEQASKLLLFVDRETAQRDKQRAPRRDLDRVDDRDHVEDRLQCVDECGADRAGRLGNVEQGDV